MVRPRATLPALIVAVTGFAWSCGTDDGQGPTGLAAGTTVPDFSVQDVNPNSTRFDEMVSPRDYTGEVSAWYFGHAT